MKKGRSIFASCFPLQLGDESETCCFIESSIHDMEQEKKVCSYCAQFIGGEKYSCEKKCPARYCSVECRVRDASFRGHQIHCSGISYTHSKYLHQYSLRAPRQMRDCIQLAIRFLSCLLCSSARHLQSLPSPSNLGDAVANRLQQLLGPAEAPFFTEEADKEVVEESYILASTMLQSEKLPEIASLLPSLSEQEKEELRGVVRSAISLERWTALLGKLRQRSVQVAAEHPLAQQARDLPQLPTATLRLQRLRRLQPFLGRLRHGF
eukprot:gene26958-35660_t